MQVDVQCTDGHFNAILTSSKPQMKAAASSDCFGGVLLALPITAFGQSFGLLQLTVEAYLNPNSFNTPNCRK